MAGAWDVVRAALATKLNASSGCLAAGMRRASDDVDAPLSMPPEVRVLQPSMTMLGQTGSTEEYVLEVPVEVVCTAPSGKRRSNPIAAAIARAIQVELRTNVTLTAATGASVVDQRLLSASPGLSEYDQVNEETGDPLYDGYRLILAVQVYETVSRTA